MTPFFVSHPVKVIFKGKNPRVVIEDPDIAERIGKIDIDVLVAGSDVPPPEKEVGLSGPGHFQLGSEDRLEHPHMTHIEPHAQPIGNPPLNAGHNGWWKDIPVNIQDGRCLLSIEHAAVPD
jgi:hypothetical protein